MTSCVRLSSARRNNKRSGEGSADLKEAFRMLDIFASCGAQSFVLTKTELEWEKHKKVKWGKPFSLDCAINCLP